MKLLHLGDLHLGRSLGEFDLIEDQKYILNQILRIIEDHSVDAVLIAGDVYDKSTPSEAATNLLDYFLTCLADKNIKTFMISGNHDSDDRLNYAKQFFANRNIFISSVFNGNLDKYTVNDGANNVNIYLLPFIKASQVRHFYPDSDIESYEDAVKAVIDNAEIDKKKCNILVAHQFVAGKGEDPRPGLVGDRGSGRFVDHPDAVTALHGAQSPPGKRNPLGRRVPG